MVFRADDDDVALAPGVADHGDCPQWSGVRRSTPSIISAVTIKSNGKLSANNVCGPYLHLRGAKPGDEVSTSAVGALVQPLFPPSRVIPPITPAAAPTTASRFSRSR
ncbi:hypothetical protein GCM10027199_85350 [Amycolatopsis magusensis]